MKRSLKFINIKQKFYTRVKAVPLTDDLVEGLSAAEMSRLKSMYLYDFYDTVKKLTANMTFINDKKRVKDHKLFDYHSALAVNLIILKFTCICCDFLMRYTCVKSTVNPVWSNLSYFTFV